MANINTATMKGDLNALTIGGTIKANQPIKANVILGGSGGGGELEPRVAALEEQVIVINQNMSSLQDDIDTINRDVSALTDRVLINETDINVLNVDVADLKAESEELTTRVTVAEQTLGALQREVTALSTRLDVDEETLTAVQQKVEALQNTLDNILRDITNLQQRMRNVEAGMLTLATAIQDVENDVADLKSDKADISYVDEQFDFYKNNGYISDNLFHYNLELGEISKTDGKTLVTSTNFARCLAYIPVTAGTYTKTVTYDGADWPYGTILKYDSEYNYLGYEDNTASIELSSDVAYVRLAVYHANILIHKINSIQLQKGNATQYVPSNIELLNRITPVNIPINNFIALNSGISSASSRSRITKIDNHIIGTLHLSFTNAFTGITVGTLLGEYRPSNPEILCGFSGANIWAVCNSMYVHLAADGVLTINNVNQHANQNSAIIWFDYFL